MLALLYYCLKVIICSGVLYGYYLLALRNNRFHQWNRWYLMVAVVLPFILPLLQIPLPDFSEDKTTLVYGVEMLAAPDFYFTAKQTESFHLTLSSASTITYSLVSLILLFLFFKNIRSIQKLKRRYREETANGIHFYNTAEPGTPFSFFKNIFWNSSVDLNTEKGQQMLRHEMAHVTEWHSFDKVLMQLLLSFAFWNPFLYFIRKEIAVVHEFIADQKASAGDDKLQYASLLLMKAMGTEQYALGNPFFHSQLKRRLVMLTTSKNPRFNYMRRVMVLPLAAISLILFSFKYKEIKEKKEKKKNADQTAYSHATNEEKVFDEYQDTTKKKVIILSNKSYKGGTIKSITPTDDLKGAVVKTTDGNTYFLDRKEAAKELDLVITDNGFTAPKDAQVVSYDSNDVPLDNYSNEKIVIGKEINSATGIFMQNSQTGHIILRGASDTIKQPLYIIEGKETDALSINSIDPMKIESINVLKDASAINKYGEKGKNGVVEVTLKKSLPNDALYILDGKESTKENIEAIKPANIQSVNILKGTDAQKKYSSKGSNGVIEIVTKKNTPSWFNDKTLLIMNGKEVSLKEVGDLHLIDRGLLSSYSEMTPSAAMKVYGEKGRNGAAIFTTKPAKNEVTFSEEEQKPDIIEKVVIGRQISTAPNTTAQSVKGRNLNEVVVVGYSEKRPDMVFTKVEQPASFPGGQLGWNRYLERNLNYPEQARKNNTQGSVQVQLTIDEEGNVTEIKALNDPGNGLAEEAIRVIKKGPKWNPAKQNGKTVNYRFIQIITFSLQ